MSVKVITTLHEDGYNLYGSEHIATWTEHFPIDWKIVYYAEKHSPKFAERVSVVDFDVECESWQDFYNAVKAKLNLDPQKNNVKVMNWYKKALRWSFKMFTLMHALKNTEERYLIWLDADVIAVHRPRDGWILDCLDEKCLAGQLEFIKAGGHVETGILIIDLHHPDIDKLYNWIKLGYVEYKILEEEKAWDGIWIAKLVQSNTIAWNNISMVIQQKVAKAFSDSSLKWLRHRVGKRKFDNSKVNERSGRTNDKELI
jgi:hypothetical protein